MVYLLCQDQTKWYQSAKVQLDSLGTSRMKMSGRRDSNNWCSIWDSSQCPDKKTTQIFFTLSSLAASKTRLVSLTNRSTEHSGALHHFNFTCGCAAHPHTHPLSTHWEGKREREFTFIAQWIWMLLASPSFRKHYSHSHLLMVLSSGTVKLVPDAHVIKWQQTLISHDPVCSLPCLKQSHDEIA